MFHQPAWAVDSYSSGHQPGELPKSKSTQPRVAWRWAILYKFGTLVWIRFTLIAVHDLTVLWFYSRNDDGQSDVSPEPRGLEQAGHVLALALCLRLLILGVCHDLLELERSFNSQGQVTSNPKPPVIVPYLRQSLFVTSLLDFAQNLLRSF